VLLHLRLPGPVRGAGQARDQHQSSTDHARVATNCGTPATQAANRPSRPTKHANYGNAPPRASASPRWPGSSASAARPSTATYAPCPQLC